MYCRAVDWACPSSAALGATAAAAVAARKSRRSTSTSSKEVRELWQSEESGADLLLRSGVRRAVHRSLDDIEENAVRITEIVFAGGVRADRHEGAPRHLQRSQCRGAVRHVE